MRAARIIALVLLISPTATWAHHDVAAAIKELDQRIAKGPTADLHYERALEYRALRKRAETEADLRKALALAPQHREALTALIQHLKDTPEALALASSYLASAGTPVRQLEARFLLATVLSDSGDPTSALAVCAEIQEHHPDHPTGIDLLHADLFSLAGKPADAAAVLKAAHQKHHGIVLRNAWIDAALSAGQVSEVLPIIESELNSSRFRASWHLRRARAALALQDADQARRDLHAALTELNSRIQPDRPDLTLLADRGLVLALLGSKDLARRDLATLQNSSLSRRAYLLLEAELK